MATTLTRTSPFAIRFFVNWLLPLMAALWVKLSPNGFLRPTWKSANDLMDAAFGVAPGGQRIAAHNEEMVYLNGNELKESNPENFDEWKRKALWSGSVELVGLKEGDTALRNWK